MAFEENVQESALEYIAGGSPANYDGFCGIESITFNKIGGHLLKKPLTFKSYFDPEDRLFCIENEFFSLHGYGETYAQAISDLGEDLETLSFCFVSYPDEKFSPESLHVKAELEKLVDIYAVAENMQKSGRK
ncbi:MAG TPA: hypothetical protein O0X70_07205 [Methanocorpusculum sp.]|nr:hypothetical protein [Methanocorpusculum sp.]